MLSGICTFFHIAKDQPEIARASLCFEPQGLKVKKMRFTTCMQCGVQFPLVTLLVLCISFHGNCGHESLENDFFGSPFGG